MPALTWVGALAITLLIVARLMRLGWTPSTDGLPDAGRFVADALPVARATTLIAGSVLLGFILSAVVLDPCVSTPKSALSASGQADLRIAAASAGVMGASALFAAILTLAQVLGLPFRQTVSPAVLVTYLLELEVSRLLLISAVMAFLVALGLTQVRAISGAALWGVFAAVAVGAPSLTGHAAGLGGHATALVAGFVHAVAASVWSGGLLALATHAVGRTPDVALRARSFGAIAVCSVLALGISGTAAAAGRLTAPADLISTAYGRLILVKVLALAVAGVLGWSVRRAVRSDGLVKARRMVVELGVLGVALGAAVVLARSQFPRTPTELPSFGEDLIGFQYPPPPTFPGVALGWDPSLIWLAVAGVAVLGYWVGFGVLRSRGDDWPLGRLVSWTLGWLVVTWATSSGLAAYSMVSFTLHMVAHMALAMLAPALLVMGAPITLALRALPVARSGTGPREWINWGLNSPLTRVLTHPAYVLVGYTVGLYGIYYTSLFSRLMTAHLGHLAMQAHFLLAGYLFYWVVIGVDQAPRRLAYPARLGLLMASLVIHSLFAVPMMLTESPMLSDWFAVVRPEWLTNPLGDTNAAGSIAWAFGEIPTLVVAIALAIQWSRSDDREARRSDRRAERDGDAELNDYNDRLARLAASDSAR